ncbi:MAG: hypothetical protein K8F30_12270, partial [Taibaiella sp.]|nr:hypothetical protein [Taibaiella sp.]
IKPGAPEYGTLINLSKDFDKGLELINQMKEEGIKPGAQTYGTLINLSKDFDKGLDLFQQMKNDGIKRNVVIYTMLIQKSNNIKLGWDLFLMMKEEGIKPNVRTLNALIWLNKIDYQRAISVYEIFINNENIEPDVYTITELMTICRRFDIAIALLASMHQYNLTPNDRMKRTLYVLAGKDEEKIRKATEMLRNIQDV